MSCVRLPNGVCLRNDFLPGERRNPSYILYDGLFPPFLLLLLCCYCRCIFACVPVHLAVLETGCVCASFLPLPGPECWIDRPSLQVGKTLVTDISFSCCSFRLPWLWLLSGGCRWSRPGQRNWSGGPGQRSRRSWRRSGERRANG